MSARVFFLLRDGRASVKVWDMDTARLFIRVNRRPRRDLARGYSYSMSAFGDEGQAHAGLSGYGLAYGVEHAVEQLDERMGVSGARSRTDKRGRVRPVVVYVTLFEGGEVGTGPDGEELFRPSRVVASWRTRDLAGPADLLARLAALGVADAEEAA